MFPRLIAAVVCLAGCALAQSKPEVRVNVVNVCTPAQAEKDEIAAALARVPAKPAFSADYEVSRGRVTDKNGSSEFVRLRREFASDAQFTNVQFVFSLAPKSVNEMLVLHTKETRPGQPLQISFDNEVTSGAPGDVLFANTPPGRIRIERFGKPSLVLARCPEADQKDYEALFRTASERFRAYREAMRVRTTVEGELSRMGNGQRATK